MLFTVRNPVNAVQYEEFVPVPFTIKQRMCRNDAFEVFGTPTDGLIPSKTWDDSCSRIDFS
jgi:hypothetical protein